MNLDIKIEDNHISNLEELIGEIDKTLVNLNEAEYLETLFNKLKYADVLNKDELIDVIRTKLVEYQTGLNEHMDNKSALETLQTYNEDLKKISIIETSKEKNDSGKDIDYISIRHDDGSVEMLVCAGRSSLGNYIKSHAGDLANLDAEEIFHYFKETVHQDLNFYRIDEIDNKNPDLANQALVREEDIKANEESYIREYAKKYGLSDKVYVTVDPSGERIYSVSDAIIKFYTNGAGERVMQTLVQPTIRQNINSYDDLLDELDESGLEKNTPEPEVELTEEAKETGMEIDVEALKKKKIAEEELENPNFSFDLKALQDLIVKKDEMEIELTDNELSYISYGVRYLVDTMVERAEENKCEVEEDLVLADYMKPILEVYEEIVKGYRSELDLSDFEKALAKDYLENREKIVTMDLLKKPKMLEYSFQAKEETKTSGITTLILVLEIVLIALLIFLCLSLDI